MNDPGRPSFLQRIGPGLLYAAAAVGVSHLVQSTRAGADYSFALWWVIVLVTVIKYPGIRFGSDYAVATGRTLIHSYVSLGAWMAWVYAGLIVLTMAFVGASLTLVVNGLLQTVFSFEASDTVMAVVLLLVSGGLMLSGKYRLLENLNKFVVPLLTLLIFIVTVLLLLDLEAASVSFALPPMDAAFLFYVVAIAGWLLTPMDGSVLQSLWTVAKAKELGQKLGRQDSHFDFNLGYWGSLVLALCFMIMGASVLYGSDVETAHRSGAFAAQVIALFSGAIGDWSYYIVGSIALLVMYSTLMTVYDGYARNLSTVTNIILGKEMNKGYEISLSIIMIAAVLVIAFFMKSFTTFIDLAGILTFVLGPFYAALNHRAMFSPEVPEDHRPDPLLKYWSLLGILVMSIVAVMYIYLRWF